MLAVGHMYAERVTTLLRAAQAAVADTRQPVFPNERLGFELVLAAPVPPPSDATNYLGGVADVLEAKSRRGALEHLGDLAAVALYTNDRQIHEVHYHYEQATEPRYFVRVWLLDP